MDEVFILVSVKVSMFRPTFGFLASLIFHSAKTTKRKAPSSEDFFALSAYSFKTAMTDQTDAYTILCLADVNVSRHSAAVAADKMKESGDLEVGKRHGMEYVLFEVSCG